MARDTPSIFAMSVAAMPLSRRLRALAASASSTLRGRPPLRPLAAAAARPARVRNCVVCRCPPLTLAAWGAQQTGVQGHLSQREDLRRHGVEAMRNTRAILRTAARANGWQVLVYEDPHSAHDTYVLPDSPDKRIAVTWAASGDVLHAEGESFPAKTA